MCVLMLTWSLQGGFFCLFFVWFGVFKRGFLCVVLAVLELYIDQADHLSLSQVPGLEVCAGMPGFLALLQKVYVLVQTWYCHF